MGLGVISWDRCMALKRYVDPFNKCDVNEFYIEACMGIHVWCHTLNDTYCMASTKSAKKTSIAPEHFNMYTFYREILASDDCCDDCVRLFIRHIVDTHAKQPPTRIRSRTP